MPKPCSKCGEENADKAKFCMVCGLLIEDAALDSDTESPWKPMEGNGPGSDDLSLSGATIAPGSPSISPQTSDLPFIPKSRYEIREEIGAGGMGKVYRAFDGQTKREVALKRLIAVGADIEDAILRFKREAHTIAQLNHPYIVPLFDIGMDEEDPFSPCSLSKEKPCRTM